ncbi:MAG TPA: tetratricopeptide repeat protein, partial [Acidobacteriota bacterium]|nr:tetratricopeptide repeat protein [Acidobacteriota bacterium]
DKTRGIDGAELLEKIGDMYASRRQFSRAAAAYREARNRISDKTPLRAELLAKLGYNLAMINEIDEAVKALEESVMIGPDNAGSLALLGDLYADQGRNGEAVDAYRRSLAVDPERKEVHYNLGTLYLQSGKAEEAHAALKNAVKVDAGFIPAWDNLAVAAEQLDLDDQAVEAREMLVRLGVREARNYFRLGVLYAKTGRLDESIASFAAAIEKEPDKYREILRDELKNVRSILNGVRYKKEFLDLLTFPE